MTESDPLAWLVICESDIDPDAWQRLVETEVDPLGCLLLRDTVEEILGAMSPEQREIAELRAEGLCAGEIVARLGISPMALERTMRQAMEEICRVVPEAAGLLAGRAIPSERQAGREKQRQRPA